MSSTVMKHQTSVKANGRQCAGVASWTIPTNERAKKRRMKKLTCQRKWYIEQLNLATTREQVERLWYMAAGRGHIDLLALDGLFDLRMNRAFTR